MKLLDRRTFKRDSKIKRISERNFIQTIKRLKAKFGPRRDELTGEWR